MHSPSISTIFAAADTFSSAFLPSERCQRWRHWFVDTTGQRSLKSILKRNDSMGRQSDAKRFTKIAGLLQCWQTHHHAVFLTLRAANEQSLPWPEKGSERLPCRCINSLADVCCRTKISSLAPRRHRLKRQFIRNARFPRLK
jgi:hypothetical protein